MGTPVNERHKPYIDPVAYRAYAHDRLMNPQIDPESWRLHYGLRAQVAMEARFCEDLLNFILAELGECDA